MKQDCVTCRYFHFGKPIAFPEADGTCRRHAPRGPAIAGSGWSAFPPVSGCTWCGEYERVRPGGALMARVDRLRGILDRRPDERELTQ